MPDDVDERVPVAVPERVDRIDVGVGLQRRVHERARPIRRRQPSEIHPEEQLGHQAEEKHRRRVDEDPEEPASPVDPRIPVAPGEHAERHADDDRDDHRVEGQLEGRRPVLDNDVPHRASVGDRRPEVTPRDVSQVFLVLDEDGLVVA